jgi:hypothetical protein
MQGESIRADVQLYRPLARKDFTMSVLDDFTADTALKITSITAILRIPNQRDSNVHSENICPDKRVGDATITVMASKFMDIISGDFPIVFGRPEVIESSDSRMVVRFSADQMFNQALAVRDAPVVQLRTVTGQVTLELTVIGARDENDCASRPKRYAVSLATTTGLTPNQLLVGVDFIGRQTIIADAITLAAIAGVERPPGPPEPLQLTEISMSVAAYCARSSLARVTGSVRMNRTVQNSDGILRVEVSALAVSSDAAIERVPVIPSSVPVLTGSSIGTFQVQIPADFEGRLIVTAVFGSDPPRTIEIQIWNTVNTVCLDPEIYYVDMTFRLFDFPCPELEITDFGHLLGWGRQDGSLLRKLADGPVIYFRESVGGDVRRAAINEFAEVAGSTIDAAGELHGFILPAGESSPAIMIKDVQLAAMNDDGLAVGYKRSRNVITAFAFALTRSKDLNPAKGQAVKLKLPTTARSEAVAVNNLGQIVVLVTDGATKILLFEKGKGTEIGQMSGYGAVRKLTDSGFVAGNEFTQNEVFQPFLISLGAQKGRIEVPALKGFEHAIALDVDERGAVMGRAFTSKERSLSSLTTHTETEERSRGFRFTTSRGTEDLNDLVKLPEGAVITAAIRTTKGGEIVVEVTRGGAIGYAMLMTKGLK